MGNFLFGQRCDHPCDESVINLSDSCIEKIMKPPEEQDTVICHKSLERLDDDKWINRLLCLDERHSDENGLSISNIERLIKQVEDKIGKLKQANCSTEELIDCLTQNERCIIKCEKYINEFIDCIDTARIEAIKKTIAKTEESKCEIVPGSCPDIPEGTK